ncbi:hypothetical protein SeMB42_g05142 [Synchytrium endobioticum]|uniref:Uncharacterized protein n=1 Tax=Synchytrium endobioticum TaxID=286115 RepID=A0A507CTB3_9FUNG|nr:hypothetical protein SeLEV6574_g07902 [Synchytrium endobioticum]TPX42379.1 hypothetical protein SeMB42_g05139 [Synchytrium endobioticum]TPX42389.1 hypothetical protein SeMB42_g05142 [Synchytrium endobioticum]
MAYGGLSYTNFLKLSATKEVYNCRHCALSSPKTLPKFKAHWKRMHKSFDRAATTDDLLLPSESIAWR